ncbi:MAG: Nif3-like dinuclear metal center hexameric protein [Opitutales bacterium]|nr:Nif3-like dinuclear metal center hexameric protein [Opitutales bacterium]
MKNNKKNSSKNISLERVVSFLDKLSDKDKVADFHGSYNGLQFQNSGKVSRVAMAVDGGIAEIDAAATLGADLLIVHHGMLWNAPIPFVDNNYKKIKTLIDNDIAVYSMHLPLDAHDKIGNNVLLAKALDLKIKGRCFEHEGKDIGVLVESPQGGIQELEYRLENLFPHTYKAIRYGTEKPKNIAICSGSCGDVVPLLKSMGIDTLICGELRQKHFTMAQEMELNLYPCGHYATERYGVMALGEAVAEKFNLPCNFIEMPNPL